MKVISKKSNYKDNSNLIINHYAYRVIRMKSYEILLKSMMNSQTFWNLYTTF